MIIWREKEIKIRHHLKRLFKFLYTLTYFIWLIPLRLYDILHGTEYGGIDKTGDKDGRFAYFPSPVISFLFLRRYVRRHIQKGRGHSVLDIGCGKGIVLLFFSRMAFDRVSGIEYDEKLCRMAEKNLTTEQLLIMGDDIPDIAMMKMAALKCCPADAVAEVKEISDYVSYQNGGNGAVRDVIEQTIKVQGRWLEEDASFW